MAMEWTDPAHPYRPIDPVLGPNRGSRLEQYTTGFWAGVLGALIMTLLLGLGRMSGVTDLNLEMILGSMLTQTPSSGAWWIGFTWHLLNGGIFALVYVQVFRKLGNAGFKLGAKVGIIHWILAGIFMRVLPALHPLIREQTSALGWYAGSIGRFEMIILLVLHCAFGAMLGGLYQASIQFRIKKMPEERQFKKVG